MTPPAFRCSLAARQRGDAAVASAPPARRFVLLEVPGPWAVADVFAASGLSPEAVDTVRHHAGAAGARVLLIRRPGRHPARESGQSRSWAVVELGDPGGVQWGTWTSEGDLTALDAALVTRGEPADRPLALVCTHGRHDVCCAVEGRPVAMQAAQDPRFDVWECSHLGGDRFAANLLLLPSGLLYGGLTASTVHEVLSAAHAGRVLLTPFRGRCGDPHAVQAVQWHALDQLGEDRPDRVVIELIEPSRRIRAVVRHNERQYAVELAWEWSPPSRLTCHAPGTGRVRLPRLVSWRDLGSPALAPGR